MSARRDFLRSTALAFAALALPRAYAQSTRAARVLIVGGGFAGATCARYLKLLAPAIDVTLVEPEREYVTCPGSNAVITGTGTMHRLRHGYTHLTADHGVQIVHDRVRSLDLGTRRAALARGKDIAFDRVAVAPGIALQWGSPEGYDAAAAEFMPHAYTPGAQTLRLRAMLEAMPDGGVFAIAVPPAPFRCPPGPYERAGLVADFLTRHRRRTKVVIFDANDKFTKQALFLEGWKQRYGERIEWVPLGEDGHIVRVEPRRNVLHSEFGRHRVALANVIPAQRAADIAVAAGLTDASGWCPVNATTFESTRVPGVHVMGDASIASPMPKSASSANSHAKNVALQIIAALAGAPPIEPSFHNTCYSLVAPDYGISINGIYGVDHGHLVAIEGAGGVSPLGATAEVRRQEAEHTRSWYASVTADAFG